MSDAPQPVYSLSESQPWYKKSRTKWIASVSLGFGDHLDVAMRSRGIGCRAIGKTGD
jgi:hypothetical protein